MPHRTSPFKGRYSPLTYYTPGRVAGGSLTKNILERYDMVIVFREEGVCNRPNNKYPYLIIRIDNRHVEPPIDYCFNYRQFNLGLIGREASMMGPNLLNA